ncbi:MAG: hypothetical protein GYB64_04160 [Chloroflexi bacterium]|nr:hypothetical protein [Chloroflexota bacterium]
MTAMGMVFTDQHGRVIFVNRHFIHMMAYNGDQEVIGRPLDEALRIGQEIAETLANTRHTGQPVEAVIEPAHLRARFHCRSQAAFDDRRSFIGTNIALSPVTRAQPIESTDDPALLRDYFTAMLAALRVVLARMAGASVRDVVDGIVTAGVRRYGWPLRVRDSEVTLTDESLSNDEQAALYREILLDVMDYAFTIIGEPVVYTAIDAAEETLSEPVLHAAASHHLRDL